MADADQGVSTPQSAQGDRRTSTVTWLLAAILTILAAWALRTAAVVAIPFVTALFVTLAVAPVDSRIRRAVPERLSWLGHLTAMLIVLVVLAAFLAGIFLAARQAQGEFPDVSAELNAALNQEGDAGSILQGIELGDPFGLEVDAEAVLERVVSYLASHASAYGRAILDAATQVVSGVVLVLFLVVLMLVEGPTWRDKMINALGERRAAGWHTTFSVMAVRFRWYILVRTGLGLLSALLYGAWLAIFGVDLIIVWSVLAFLLNYIPTIGSLMAAALPALYALSTKDWGTALMVAGGLLVIEQVMGNYVDPRLQGRQLSVSPLVTFFALLLFAWIWGVVGALLAVPIAVFVVVGCANIDSLRPVGLILSNCHDMDELRETTTR
ncbi:AI-2E family transporter [Acuticoccus yangtzensis]|uniref:AI-2E family transporter n=1 Tax=Acuticoccus yangtzensis TaxID=1443441 RepID=UPI0009499803|nr:AI-2E family transporter [Acuticoccus yangtzensis]